MADIAMPDEIIAWTKSNGWGPHHLRWHVERIWDRLDADTLAYAQQQGWTRYPVQEGEETNGLAFLAMHRVMIRNPDEPVPGACRSVRRLEHAARPIPTMPTTRCRRTRRRRPRGRSMPTWHRRSHASKRRPTASTVMTPSARLSKQDGGRSPTSRRGARPTQPAAFTIICTDASQARARSWTWAIPR